MKAVKPKERLISLSLSKATLILTSELSYRKAVTVLNLLYHRDNTDKEIKVKTVSDYVENKGSQVARQLLANAQDILTNNGFDAATNLPLKNASIPSWKLPPPTEKLTKQIKQAVCDFNCQLLDNRARKEEEKIDPQTWLNSIEEDKETCCYISIDDIGVKRQKRKRKGSPRADSEAKVVENTVIHIQVGDDVYFLTATSMQEAFTLLLAFLLQNNLLDRKLIFFTDGAVNIKNNIETVFAFHPHSIILDWYHLEKKCREYVSASICGKKEEKQSFIKNLLTRLWVGNVSAVIQELDGLKTDQVKSDKFLQMFKGYLQRKQPFVPCYALRRSFNLRLGSSLGEKANDILVATRQKHNSMSWSQRGSGALASLKMLVKNKTFDEWLSSGCLTLDWPAVNNPDPLKCAA